MARWTFVRHAQSASNAARWYSGHTDVPLTEQGIAQARAAGDALREARFDQAFASDLQRASHTARLILDHHPEVALSVTPNLRERDLGEWTGLSYARVQEVGGRDVFFQVDGRPPKGESLLDVALRMLPWLDSLPPADHTLVVAHGGTLAILLGLLDDKPWPDMARERVANATPIVREVAPGTWRQALRRVQARVPGA